MDELSKQVLKGFFVKPSKIIKDKNSYLVYEEEGIRVIKKCFDSLESISLAHLCKEHLASQGFFQTDRFYLSAINKPYFIFEDKVYTMSDYLDGRPSSFALKEEFKKIIKALAIMHRLLKNMDTEQQEPISITNGLQKDMARLLAIKKRLKTQSRLSDFDVLFLKNYDYYIDKLALSLDGLIKTDIAALEARALVERSICHNLLKEENILISKKDLHITSFTGCTIDTPLKDLASLIQRYGKKLPEDYLGLEEILWIYSKYNPLSAEDIETIYYLLQIPGRFIKICGMYYSKKRSWTPSALTVRIEGIISEKAKYEEYVSSIKKEFTLC